MTSHYEHPERPTYTPTDGTVAETGLAYASPETVRQPATQTPEMLAFQVAQEALNLWPADAPRPDRATLSMITDDACYTAQTIHLNTLAAW